jgi:hypothetical protein
MKKTFLAAAIVASCFVSAQQISATSAAQSDVQTLPEQTQPVTTTEQKTNWDFFQLGFWFGIPSETEYTDVYGIKVGAPGCGGKGTVNGIETSVFASGTDHVNGVSSSVLVATSKQVKGFQGSIVNFCDDVDGVQLGVFNMAKDEAFQIGIINYIENSPIPVLPVINVRFIGK